MIKILIIPAILFMNTSIFFDFEPGCNMSSWNIVNDVVMGGRSSCSFNINDKGHGEFKGSVSLANNGGFSSVRYRAGKTDLSNYSSFVIRLKGDGKDYQFRAKTSSRDYYSYINYFSTSGKWQTIEIPFNSLYPSFRGRKLDLGNFPGEILEEIGFLIGNNKAEDFRLLIDKIELK